MNEERFWSYVNKSEDCWNWTGGYRAVTNLEQAKAIFNPVPKKIRGCDGTRCRGLRCMEVHRLGVINPPTFTGADYLWGTGAAGSLMADWDIHGERYVRVYGLFPDSNGGVISEDYDLWGMA